MKKLLLVSLFLIGGTLTARAQFMGMGPRLGASISNYTGDIDSDPLVSPLFGGFFNFGFGKVFSLQPEILFATMGAKIDTVKYKASYLNAPVLLKFGGRKKGVFFEIGPQLGLNVNEHVDDQSVRDYAKALDWSAVAGLGFQSKGGFGVGARYVLGVSKVGNEKAGKELADTKNSVVQVSVFWMIGGKWRKGEKKESAPESVPEATPATTPAQ